MTAKLRDMIGILKSSPSLDRSPAPEDLRRGRIWYVEDVMELYGTTRAGEPVRSRAWVLERFAPEARHREGRLVFWFERDVWAWFDSHRGVR